MKIAFTHNLRLTDSEEEAEFDTAETVDAIAGGLRAGGHEVEKIEVTGPASHLAARIESFAPDLIFNTAEGRRGRTREAFYPALFEELGFPYTGSDAYVMTVTLDKWLTKLMLGAQGIDTPRARLVVADDLRRSRETGVSGLAFPVIVKPNYEGSSKGIGDDAVVRDPKALADILPRVLRKYPSGVLVEEFIAGTDVTVPFIEGLGDDGVLLPVDYVVDPGARSKFNIYDYRLKSTEASRVQVRCPPDLPRDVTARLRALSRQALRALGVRDLGRVDFRIGEDGRIYLLEVNALPSLERGASLFAAAAREGLDYEAALGAIVASAGRRQGLMAPAGVRRRRPADNLRIGFTYNVKRVATKGGNDAEAEYDAPETIDAIRDALESYGHVVIPLEATAELPRQLTEVAGRSGLQHRRGRLGPEPRGGGAGAVRADGDPLHRLGRRHAVHRPRQGAVQAGAARARHPHARVPGDGERARAPVAQAEVPADREAQPGGLQQGRQRPRLGVRQRGGAAGGGARPAGAVPPAGAGRGLHRRARVHGRPARGQATARVAADGDRVPGTRQPAAGLRLPDQAGVGETRLLRVPGQADPGRAEGHRARLHARPSTPSTAGTWPASICG